MIGDYIAVSRTPFPAACRSTGETPSVIKGVALHALPRFTAPAALSLYYIGHAAELGETRCRHVVGVKDKSGAATAFAKAGLHY